MDGFDPMQSFGPDVAAAYDDHLRGDEAETVSFLASLAGAGRALELAIGTGRIAVPLMDAGVPVDGIEQSAAMIERLHARRPATAVTKGDMATADAPASAYSLVFLVYNDGRTQFVDAERVAADEVVLDVNRYDPVTQLLSENHVRISAAGISMGPIAQRVPFPSELDLMARLRWLSTVEPSSLWDPRHQTAPSPHSPAGGRVG